MTHSEFSARGLSPRPFPLHLILAMSALASSKIGSPRWSAGWPNSSAPPPALPDDLAREIAKADPAAFDRALDREIAAACDRFALGVESYRRHAFRRPEEAARTVWRRGAATLLDHGGADSGIPVLFIPSLINRGWVLDLIPGEGMLSWLAGQGIHPYRIEWGAPGPEELNFDIADYVRRRLDPAIGAVRRIAGRPIVLAGYCMGGLLTIAAALRRPDDIAALALLGTPWDFHTEGPEGGQATGAAYRLLRPIFQLAGSLPIDAIQAFFALHDPAVALRKFQRFATLDPASADARQFVALEDWLNEGVALSLPVADDAILGWRQDNAPARGAWRVGGAAVDPAALKMPVLVATPGTDRIVPPASAAAILPRLANVERLDPPLGHIGMVVGRQAPTALWAPLADWLRRAGGQRAA